jgi:hypothetical protein
MRDEWRKLETERRGYGCSDIRRLDLLPGLIRKMERDLGLEEAELGITDEQRKSLGMTQGQPLRFHDPACTAISTPPGGFPRSKDGWPF